MEDAITAGGLLTSIKHRYAPNVIPLHVITVDTVPAPRVYIGQLLSGRKRRTGRVMWKLPFDMIDCLTVIGACLVCYGVYLIYHPAAFLLGGVGLIYLAIQIERGKRGKPD